MAVNSNIFGGIFGSFSGGTNGSRVLTVPVVDTSSIVTTAGKCYARYLGRWSVPLTTIDLLFYIHGVAAVAGGGGPTLNWAELAIGTSPTTDIFSTNINLTALAYVSIDTEAKIASTTCYKKTLSGIIIPANTDMWIMIAGSYQTTQMSLRSCSVPDIRGAGRTKTSYQPSLNIGSAQAFTGTPGVGLTIPWLEGQAPM